MVLLRVDKNGTNPTMVLHIARNHIILWCAYFLRCTECVNIFKGSLLLSLLLCQIYQIVIWLFF